MTVAPQLEVCSEDSQNSQRGMVVKNTFIDIVDDDELNGFHVRSTKSLPASCRMVTPSLGEKLTSIKIRVVDDGEDSGQECPSPTKRPRAATDAPAASDTAATSPMPRAARKPGRVKSVTFVLPPKEEDEIEPDSDEATASSPMMCHVRTAAFDEDDSPAVCSLRTARSDDESSPGVCHLQPLAFDRSSPGPHMGLLWLPAGCTFAPPAFPPGAAARPASPPLVAVAPPNVLAAGDAAGVAAGLVSGVAANAPAAGGAPGWEHDAALIAPELRGQVWTLAQDQQGCRRVQAALDEAANEQVREALAFELRGHVWEAAQSPYANFVLQKVVTSLRAESLQFVVDELPPEVAVQAAKHKCGCRIIQRLVEQCTSSQTQPLVEAILADFSAIARSPYGNYVAQHLAEHGPLEQRGRVMELLKADLKRLAAEPFGSASLGGALTRGPPDGQVALARAMVCEPGIIVFLACTRHGSASILRVLEVLQGDDREKAKNLLEADMDSLMASRFGRIVAQAL